MNLYDCLLQHLNYVQILAGGHKAPTSIYVGSPLVCGRPPIFELCSKMGNVNIPLKDCGYMQDIEFFENIQKYRTLGLDIALITIVESRGSTPRGMGAKMALLPNGKCLGTIGGGCVESKVKSAALDVLIENHSPQTVTSYLNEKIGVEDGDICGGSVTVLIEYLPAITSTLA